MQNVQTKDTPGLKPHQTVSTSELLTFLVSKGYQSAFFTKLLSNLALQCLKSDLTGKKPQKMFPKASKKMFNYFF